MLERLLPLPADNLHRGATLALWLLALIVLVKAAMGLNVIFNGRSVAVGADGIALDSFTAGGAQTVLAMFAIWGLGQLVLCAVGTTALLRYRSLVPFAYSLFLFEHLGRKLILRWLPVARTGSAPGSWVNLALVALMLTGLALSLVRPQAEG